MIRLEVGADRPASQAAADYSRLTPSALYTQGHGSKKSGALGIPVGRKVLYRPSEIERFFDEYLAEAFASHR